MKQLLFILPLAMGISSSPLAAAVDRTRKPQPDPAPAASFPDYHVRRLSNGLTVFVIEDDRKPTLNLRLLVKSGSAADGEKTGLASFTAGLLNRGTQKRDAAAFAKETDFLGMRLEAMASADSISVSAGALTRYTAPMLELFAEAVLTPVFPGEQFAKEQKKALSTLEAERQEPDRLAGKLSARVLYGSHPYGAVSTPESVRAISREDLVRFHSTHFRPNNATLAVVGDVKCDQILPQLEAALGKWEKAEVPVSQPPAPHPLSGVKVHLLDRPGSVQSNIVVAKAGPARNSGPIPELNVLNATLGGGFSGRLFQNLREKNGWTYGAYSSFDPRKLLGAFQAGAETRNEVTHLAITEILKEMDRLQKEPIPEAELELQRQYNVGNYLLSLESPGRTAQRVQDMDLYGLPDDFYKTYARRMESVTAAHAQELAARFLAPENVAVIVVGEARQIRAALEKIGPVTVYDADLKPEAP